MRRGLADRVRQATDHERSEQERLRRTKDFAEGVAASSQRREPDFTGS
jgi:enoyl-CoA hydratase/carnithine racemase